MKKKIALLKNIISILLHTFLSVKNLIYSCGRILKKIFAILCKWTWEICEKILLTVYSAKLRYIVLLYVILFVIGRLIAVKEDFKWSLIHQIDLTIISLIGLYMLQNLHNIVTDTRDRMLGICTYISEPLNKLNNHRLSPLNLFVPIFPVISFVNKIIKLNFVPLSITGFYAIFMAASAFYIALVCYWQLILSTITIYKLTCIEYVNLPFTFPNDLFEAPKWINSLVNIYKKMQFSFFTVGTLFTAEYIMLMPSDISIIDSNRKFNKNLPFELWSTWIIIFVFIIFAFPTFWILLKKLFIKLARHLNKKVVQQLSAFNNEPINDITSIWSYYQLINNAIKFEDKLFPKYNIYPLIATSVSFILNLAKLYELIKLPLLGSSI